MHTWRKKKYYYTKPWKLIWKWMINKKAIISFVFITVNIVSRNKYLLYHKDQIFHSIKNVPITIFYFVFINMKLEIKNKKTNKRRKFKGTITLYSCFSPDRICKEEGKADMMSSRGRYSQVVSIRCVELFWCCSTASALYIWSLSLASLWDSSSCEQETV